MEPNTTGNITAPVTNEPTPATVQEPQPNTTPQGGGLTFTQTEVDAIVSREKAKAVAKATKGMPGSEELEAFRTWQESQKTQQQKWDDLTQKKAEADQALVQAQQELEQYKRESYLLSQGIARDDVDYYAFKISKTMTEGETFETAAARYLTERTAVQTSIAPNGVRMSTGPSFGSTPQPMSINDKINLKLRGKI